MFSFLESYKIKVATYRKLTHRVLHTTMTTANHSPLTCGHMILKIFNCHFLGAVLEGAFHNFLRATCQMFLFEKNCEKVNRRSASQAHKNIKDLKKSGTVDATMGIK